MKAVKCLRNWLFYYHGLRMYVCTYITCPLAGIIICIPLLMSLATGLVCVFVWGGGAPIYTLDEIGCTPYSRVGSEFRSLYVHCWAWRTWCQWLMITSCSEFLYWYCHCCEYKNYQISKYWWWMESRLYPTKSWKYLLPITLDGP